MVVLLVFPAMTVALSKLVLKNKQKLREKDFSQQYGVLYSQCDTFKGNGPLHFFAIFCVRRYIVALVVGFLPDFTLV